MFKHFLIVAGVSMTALAQPSIRLVENAASFGAPGYLNSGIAQGSLFAIKGTGLAPAGTLAHADGFPLATNLAGVSVLVTVGSVVVDAYITDVGEQQVNAILPSNTPKGAATVTLTSPGQTSGGVPITVVATNFGIFTMNQNGTGPALAHNVNSDSDQPLNTLVAPAHPGQVVTVRGTGLGAVAGNEGAGPLPGDLHPDLQLTVGTAQAQITYAGRSGCCAGIDEVSFVVPPDTLGCYVPVVFYHGPLNYRRITDIAPQSNFTTISISADGSTCTDPTGLSGAEIDQLQQAGSFRAGSLVVEQWHPFDSNMTTTTVAGSFGNLSTGAFLQSRGIFGYPPLGSCLSYPVTRDDQSTPFAGIAPSLDAGSSLVLSGAMGSLQAPRLGTGGYVGSANGMALAPGAYTLSNGDGGGDVGSFQVPLTVPAPLQWLNRSAFEHPSTGLRGTNIPFQWSGADPNAFVVLTSLGYTFGGGAYTICTAPGDAGNAMMPGITFAIVGIDGSFGSFPNIFGLGEVMPTQRFTAPGLEAGYVSVLVGDGVLVP